jgi:hypothetical protein
MGDGPLEKKFPVHYGGASPPLTARICEPAYGRTDRSAPDPAAAAQRTSIARAPNRYALRGPYVIM